MHSLGNILIFIAALIYIAPLQVLAFESSSETRDEGSAGRTAILVLGPFWMVIAAVLTIVTSRGGFDWMQLSRSVQHLASVVAIIGLFIISGMCYVSKFGPVSKRSRALRCFLGFVLLVLPLAALGSMAIALNAALFSTLPPSAHRVPLAILCGIGLLATASAIFQWLVARQLGRIEALRYFLSRSGVRNPS